MAIAIYQRVSSFQQDMRSQEADLKMWAKGKKDVVWYSDKATGANFNREGWQKLENDISVGKIKELVVWRLDRLGRTTGETIILLDRLESVGVKFVSIKDNFDPSTVTGRLMRNVICSFSSYESEIRKERQYAGIKAAKAQGKKWGGRAKGVRITLTMEKEHLCQKMKAEGQKVAFIARSLGLSRKTVYVALKAS
jgi:DNA invertase Pin-like site-specific DNA recombinase